MYAELQMELETKEINYRQSSNLQGVIMENISPEYAARLHGNQLNPYSQCITRENNNTIWTIKTLNEEAYENIIMPLSECTDIFLRKKGLSISVCNKRMHLKNDNELITEFYEKKCPKYLEIKFQTPTVFFHRLQPDNILPAVAWHLLFHLDFPVQRRKNLHTIHFLKASLFFCTERKLPLHLHIRFFCKPYILWNNPALFDYLTELFLSPYICAVFATTAFYSFS